MERLPDMRRIAISLLNRLNRPIAAIIQFFGLLHKNYTEEIEIEKVT